MFKNIFRIIGFTIIGLLLLTLIHVIFGICIYRVKGQSMFPALYNGESVVSINGGIICEIPIKRHDIITFNFENMLLVKRVIGLPGDHIVIDHGRVSINGTFEDRSFLVFNDTPGKSNMFLENDEYFVLGDNRSASYDSRMFGPIKKSEIIDKILIRWPQIITR